MHAYQDESFIISGHDLFLEENYGKPVTPNDPVQNFENVSEPEIDKDSAVAYDLKIENEIQRNSIFTSP